MELNSFTFIAAENTQIIQNNELLMSNNNYKCIVFFNELKTNDETNTSVQAEEQANDRRQRSSGTCVWLALLLF